ncbi:MAG: hypothetical protein E6Q32_13025 [Neisseriales bacterium]|nr:MAG: hypothetical protein E6Q32_13025 [Neisseriales bacterium]
MNDQEYLAKLISLYEQLEGMLPYFRAIITDPNGTILFCSKMYQSSRDKEILEVGSKVMPEKSGKYAPEESIKEWKNIVETKKPQHAINVNYFDGKIQPFITAKYPIINQTTGNVIAIYNIRQEVKFTTIQHQLMRALEIYDEPQDVDISQYKLTTREKQIIFLLLGGLCSREIATILSKVDGKNISSRTIDNIFTNQLRPKFNAFSREDLYAKLIKLGFDKMIPKDLLINIKIPLQNILTY